MNEETGITVVAAVGIAVAVIVAVLLIRYWANQQNRRPQSGPTEEPNGLE